MIRKKKKKDIEEERKMFEKRDEILKHYMAGEVHPMNKNCKKNWRKRIDEPKIRRLWTTCRATHFSMRRIEEEEEEKGDCKGRGV